LACVQAVNHTKGIKHIYTMLVYNIVEIFPLLTKKNCAAERDAACY